MNGAKNRVIRRKLSMADNNKNMSKKARAKKLAIRIICIVLAVSMVITTLYLVIMYLIEAFK